MVAVKRDAGMEIIPAIDLREGRVVRLRQGDFERESTFGGDPVAVARQWAEQGARRLHLVDLDGARAGHPVQASLVERIISSVSIPCQVGGGIRTSDDARRMQALGADRVILGTALLRDRRLGPDLVKDHGAERIVAAIDVRGGMAVGSAWAAGAAGEDYRPAVERLCEAGLRWFAVTSVERDGMLTGPDLATLIALRDAFPKARLIASGGIATVADLRVLAGAGMAAAILGRSLYEGRIDLTEALAATSS
ncbi:MAG: 1-(5-phosphoribosyl)-5-[(5-phosphoribosylamino)methylideneamino] imidazole-4-carboxamide isomerase [Chloroflexota bacterium]|nr:1-(5-phosphoribosyl)-5-[(5-phosphoribosylamino)methylideneamino] imidazole-4-carboxamide isomerase [Chloroflexota bacterium]